MKSEYNRAYDKCKRSTFWKNTTSKTQYEVEILFEHDNYEFIENKEIEFVALYGRRNLGLGTLVNLTNGGDGNKGVVHTEEMRYNKRESIKNSRVIQETKRILCEKRTGEKFISKQGQEYTIVAYRSTKSCDIQFEDGTIVENKAYGDIKRREVSNPNYPSYFGIGYIGAVKLGKKYRVMFNKKHVGLYDTPEEASTAYKQVKEKHTKGLAEKWKIKIDLQIYNYLLNYKVEVTK